MSESLETIFGKVCVERGWATREQVADLLRRRVAGGPSSLSTLLVRDGVVTPEQADSLRAEVARLVESGDYEVVRKEDASLGQILVKKGLAAKEHVLEALSIQEHLAGKGGPAPRLGEILIEKGHVPFSVLEEVLHLQVQMAKLRCAACGSGYSIADFDSRRKYLCRKCTGPLEPAASGRDLEPAAPTPLPAAEPRAAPSAPDEDILRASADPKNQLGKYVLVRELGHGGMGAVYKAWDASLKRWVAIKVLTASLGGGEELLRFQREAQTAAALQHPGIVPIYDVAQEGGRHFITMRYLEGRTLAGQTLPPRRACEILVEVARAVDYAHANRVVHRDLKPQNIMVDASGKPWVMDFGLAKHAGGMNLTSPGTVVGTPSYMSPEQAAGNVAQIDPRSDVYSLGAILYELLTGRPPFKGATAVETIKMVVSRPLTPPSKINPDVPRDIETVVLKAMEKDKGRRHPTASAFARDLERHLSGQRITVRRPSPVRDLRRRVRRNPVVFILVAFGILAFLAALVILLT